MMNKPCSIRMHASYKEKHVSGAERIAESRDVRGIMHQLLERALGRLPEPDSIVLHCDEVAREQIKYITSLDVFTLDCPDIMTGRNTALRILECAGVHRSAAQSAVKLLAEGAAFSGGVMRGAVLMDAATGKRLEQDQERGVRASRFDWSAAASEEVDGILKSLGLPHNRTREALALASKVAHGPGVVAELCWSDDPAYTAGYVASLLTGYVRFPHLKRAGDPLGGRVFFIDVAAGLEQCIRYLQNDPVLIGKVGRCNGLMNQEEYFHVRTRA